MPEHVRIVRCVNEQDVWAVLSQACCLRQRQGGGVTANVALACRYLPDLEAELPYMLSPVQHLPRSSAAEGAPGCQKVAGRWASMRP